MSQLLLSIVIPVYNSEKFISNTLSMLVSQGLDDCEIIVVNDGSTDLTENITKSYVAMHKEIKAVSIPNSGVSVARNTGLEIALGKYIYFLDSDDTLMPGTLLFFKTTLREKNVDMFVFGYKSFKNNNRQREYINSKYSKLRFDNSVDFLRLFLAKKIYCLMCNIIISNAVLKKSGVLFTPGLKIGEDMRFIINILSMKHTVYYDARICFVYLIRNDSASRYKTYNKDKFNFLLVLQKDITELVESYPSILLNANFYLANIYSTQLFYYIKSKYIDTDINKCFLSNRKLLFAKMQGNMLIYIRMFLVRFVSIKFLFCFFGKYKNNNVVV